MATIEVPICPRDCDCKREPIYGVVKGDKGPRIEVIATAVECKLIPIREG